MTIVYRRGTPQLEFAVAKLDVALRQLGRSPTHRDLASLSETADILIISDTSEVIYLRGLAGRASLDSIQEEGFQILRLSQNNQPVLCVVASDETGSMYGLLDLAEQIQISGSLSGVKEKRSNPHLSFRAIKFNLPWSAYRGSENEAMNLHMETARDLRFWERFLDMMAENHFNVLSLWNLHPFPYMIRAKNFPEATPFSDKELAGWQRFWRQLFEMAKNRGIDTYLVNWNIVVSPEMAKAHGVKERNDTSAIVRRYTRESVTQVINEYENLTGLGVTLADWMNNFEGEGKMTPKEREDWIEGTFIEGIKRADRPARFIHRSVLAGSPIEMRRVISSADFPDPVWVPIKFNWSHGHSTPRLSISHEYHSGEIDERFWTPRPKNYHIAWTVRNEDFFILRWGQPEFIRRHIARNNKEYVKGYIIGSEDYIPAKDYSHEKPSEHVTWDYAFEKQWLFYKTWGRLLYNPDTPDRVFEAAFSQRYGESVGETLLRAYKLASRMPLRLASFYRATWDFTLYSEGFLAPARSGGLFDEVSPFISVDELIEHETLDSTYLSIPDYISAQLEGEKIISSSLTPLELADSLEQDGEAALELVKGLTAEAERNLETLACEIADVQAWAQLSRYFAEKLRGGVALETFRRTGRAREKEKAVSHLERAADRWDAVVSVTEPHYHAIPTVELDEQQFSWANFQDQVRRDIQIARRAKPEK